MTTAHAAVSAGRPARFGPADVVRILLGVLLLTAAAMKGHQLATEPVGNCGQLSCKLLPLAEVNFELLLGAWLVSGLFEQAARLLAAVCFAAFAMVTFYKGYLGETSCGCFGKVQVNPWITFVIDVSAVAALLIFRRSAGGGSARAGRIAVVAILVALAGVGATVAVARYQPARLSDGGEIVGSGAVLLEPASWKVGQRWPLLAQIRVDGDVSLDTGTWNVMLFRSECLSCRRAIRHFDEQTTRQAQLGLPVRFALVELPPLPQRSAIPAEHHFTIGHLPDDRAWFSPTPVLVVLRDGNVLKVSQPDIQP